MIADIRGLGVSTLSPARGRLVHSGGGGSSLLDGLVSYWKLDDAANGTRLDSIGTNNLADALGNVGQDNAGGIACTPALVHCAGGFGQTGNNNTRLSIADNASLGIGLGKSFTMTGWTFGNSGSTPSNCMGKFSGTGGLQDYGLYVSQEADSHYYYHFTAFNLAGTQVIITPTSGDSHYFMNGASWRFVVFGYDDTNQRIFLSAGSAPAGFGLDAFPAYTQPCVGVRRTACAFQLGNLTLGVRPWWGSLDEVGFWSRVLTAAEVTRLWNNGTPLPLASF